MPAHTIETVTFRLREGVSREEFLAALPASSDFVRARPGFVSRRLSSDEAGLWIEHIEWESLEHAKAAAAAMSGDAGMAAFGGCIDGPSVAMHHTRVEVALERDAS